jgi:hypothetical protein
MSYEEYVLKTESILVEYTEKKLKDEFKSGFFFKGWIEGDCDHEFGFKFLETFKEVFGENIYEEDESIIYYTGRQMVHLLQSIKESNIIQEEDKIIELAKTFVSDQVGDFHNWCGDVCMRMTDESEDLNKLD